MPRVAYTPKKFKPESERIIARANAIIGEYQQAGLSITLRQLYYQFVARGLIPNRDTEYKRLGSIINDARLAGRIDWLAIVDRTRNLQSLAHWRDPEHIVRIVSEQYRTERWARQPRRVEVWIEKDALVGVIEQVCEENDVAYFSCRGYTSASEVWSAAQRIRGYMEAGQAVTILHLGDHDPSGKDMTRDIEDRLRLFIVQDWVNDHADEIDGDPDGYSLAAIHAHIGDTCGDVWSPEIRRIALNWDQIEQYTPPPNPAKITDSRAAKYIDEYGRESWELDALDPIVLRDLIDGHISSCRDGDLWDEATAEMEQQREALTAVSDRWGDVVDFLEGEAS